MQHVYSREVNPDADDSLARIVSMIPDGARVLDVGTGSGALGRYLGQHQCKVDGLTYAAAEAELAKPSYVRLQLMDLEQTLPSSVFGDARYDYIVCADILEHLRNAPAVLADLRDLLAPDGRILISIPNPTHLGVILGLLGGRFARPEEGLLDKTHVQFMDRQGLEAMVRSAVLAVVEYRNVRKGIHQSEFFTADFSALPPMIRSYVISLPDADTYQFVWMLKTRNGADVVESPPRTMPTIDVRPRFAAKLFLDQGQGFAEPDYAWGLLDEVPQTLVFDGLDMTNTRALRLDPGDRAGMLEFFHLRLLDAQGNIVWEWLGDWSSDLRIHACELPAAHGIQGGRLMRIRNWDASITFNAPVSGWKTAARAELRMTAPLPYLDAAFAWTGGKIFELSGQLQHAQEHLMALRHELDGVYASSSWRLTGWLRALKRRLSRHSD